METSFEFSEAGRMREGLVMPVCSFGRHLSSWLVDRAAGLAPGYLDSIPNSNSVEKLL